VECLDESEMIGNALAQSYKDFWEPAELMESVRGDAGEDQLRTDEHTSSRRPFRVQQASGVSR
jgi:hypothetical protein